MIVGCISSESRTLPGFTISEPLKPFGFGGFVYLWKHLIFKVFSSEKKSSDLDLQKRIELCNISILVA